MRIDYSAHLAFLAEDLCRRVPALQHIDRGKIVFALSRSRAQGLHGSYARIAPLRFAGGAKELTCRRGRWVERYRMPALRHEGREILYVIYIMVPRFLRLSMPQKLATVIHELFHISENCDGDIRRFAGRNFAHGSSRRTFNEKIARMQVAYLDQSPEPEHIGFLHFTEMDWCQGRMQLTGLSIPLPRARLVERRKEG